MNTTDASEAFGVLDLMLTALLGTLSGQTGRQGSALRYAVGDLRAVGLAQIQAGTLGLPLVNCFLLAYYAGADLDGMDRVRAAMMELTPSGDPAKAIAASGIRFALGRSAAILASRTLTSLDAVKAALSRINDAFEAAEEFAADNRAPTVYQALIALHAAVVLDLTTRGRPLPKMVAFTFAKVMTSHALANRLYGDAGRADELRQENSIIHPAFCPPAGVALSE